jgi:7-cyano-7-deazaguanine synthase
MAKEKAVVLLSGGMDSTVLAYNIAAQGYDVHCLSVNYGQRHKKELEFAAITARKLNAEHRIVDLSGLNVLLAGSALTSQEVEVPHGHYAADNMAITVVPNRNAILLSIATGWAVSLGASGVYFAAHSGDHAQYPDCKPEFVRMLSNALVEGNEGFMRAGFRIYAPFVNISKTEIAYVGDNNHVPFEDTWSCYEGGELHCGRCGTCVERIEALYDAGVNDKTQYADSYYWMAALGRTAGTEQY